MPGPPAAAAAGEQAGSDSSAGMDWGQLLEQLQGSQEWGQLREELQGTAGGGALVAGLVQRALHAAVAAAQHGQEGQQQGQQQGQQGRQLAESSLDVQQLVSAVQQAAWEKLHTGSWHEVGVVWRDAYSMASLLGAITAVLWPGTATTVAAPARAAAPAAAAGQGQPELGRHVGAAAVAAEAAAVEAALRQLDLAAIMGGPLFRPAVDALIDQLQARWEQLYTAQQAQQAQHAQQAQQQQAQQQGQPQQGSSAKEAPGPQGPALAAPGQAAIPLPPGSLGPRGTPVPLEVLPSLETFWREYMNREGGPIPVLIDGAMETWPALHKWNDVAYLRRVAGPRTVPVELGEHYLADRWGQELMTLAEFIDTHILGNTPGGGEAGGGGGSGGGSGRDSPAVAAAAAGPAAAPAGGQQGQQGQQVGQGQGQQAARRRGYLAQHPLFEQIPALAADIRKPDYCVLGEGELQSVNAWFGPAGTVTPLHTDPHHNLLCQVVGRKYLRIYSPADTPAMYPFSEGLTTNSSQVDLDSPDPERFPLFASAPFRDCLLEPGQMLYLPPGWWHYVKSLDTSFSVSFWWK